MCIDCHITKGHDIKLVCYKLNVCLVLIEYICNGQVNYTVSGLGNLTVAGVDREAAALSVSVSVFFFSCGPAAQRGSWPPHS
jgi:hypothetical protein